jgi:hypothetical protein
VFPRIHPIEVFSVASLLLLLIFLTPAGCARMPIDGRPVARAGASGGGGAGGALGAVAQKLNVGGVPKSLTHVDASLDWLIVVAIGGLGVAAALWFLAPEAHALSLPIVGGAGTVLALSLLLKTALWLIPYLAIALLLAGALFLYERFYKSAIGNSSAAGEGGYK